MFARKMILVGAIAVGAMNLGLTGCASTDNTHKANVNAAEKRWSDARSNMMLSVAQQQFEAGDLDEAEKTLAGAIGKAPDNALLHVLGGRIALERGQLERAAQRLNVAATLDEKLPEAHYYLGIVQQRWQRYEQALESYTRASEIHTDNPAFLLARSEMLIALDRVDEAIALLEERSKEFDQNAGIRSALGQLYAMKGDHDRAIRYFTEAAVMRPGESQIIERLAASYIATEQYDAAIGQLEQLVRLQENVRRTDLRRMLASAYQASGRTDQALQTYQRLTRENPNDADAWLRMAEISWSQDDLSGTLVAANRAISASPHRQDGYLLSGLVWQKRGRNDEALRMFDRAATLAPKEIEALLMRGILLEKSNQPAAAASAYREALRRQPNDARVSKLLANVSSTDATH